MFKHISKFLIGALLLCVFLPNDVCAQDILTLPQATELAIQNSKALQQVDYDIERKDEVRDSLADKVKYIPSGSYTDPAVASAWTGLVSTDLNLIMTKKSKTIKVDAITLNVMQKYIDVLTAQENYEYVKKSLDTANSDWTISRLSYDVGSISKRQLTLANTGTKMSLKNLEAAQTTLDKAYQELNSLLGYGVDVRYQLVDDTVFEPMEIENLDATITRIMDGNPSIWLAEQQVDLANLSLSLYNWANAAEPYKAKEIDVDKAELSVQESKEAIRNALYTSYQSIKQLEQTYALSEQALKTAEEEYENNKLMYEIGMLSKTSLDKSELSLLKAQVDVKKSIYQYEVSKQAFYKPWAFANDR